MRQFLVVVVVGLLGAAGAFGQGTAPADDDRGLVLLREAFAALEAGDLERSAELCRSAGEAATDDRTRFQAALGLGSCLAGLGRAEEARGAFERALALFPDDPTALVRLGQTLGDLGRNEEAAAVLERAVAADPSVAQARLALALVTARLGRHEEAARSAAEAAKLTPDDPRAHLAVGVALYHLERYGEAVPALERALGLSPDHPGAHYALGLCKLYLEDRDGAVAEVAVLNRLDPNLANDLFGHIFPKP